MIESENPVATTARTWKFLSLIEWSTDHLSSQGFEDCRLNAELLLAHVLQLSRVQLYTQYDRPLSLTELAAYKSLFRRRLAHEPLQYILGETEFMGLPLFVNPSVLIPRPETEQLVERSLEALRAIENGNPAVLDIGTGSGNIVIAVGVHCPTANITSVDISAAALETARRNVERHHIKNIKLLQADVFTDFLPDEAFDLIVSNPPYISAEDFETLQPEIRDFEPKIATTDGGDGLRFIRRISDLAMKKLKPGGWLLMEVAYNQSEQAQAIARENGLTSIEICDDLSGVPRIIRGRK